MFKNLRIIFCIIAVALTAICIFIFVYLGWVWGFICAAAAIVCYFLMVYFKRKQESIDGTANPPAAEGDFITGRVKADDVNERAASLNSAVTIEGADGTRTFILTKGDGESFDKVGAQTALGKAVWLKKTGDEITYLDGELKEHTVKIINIE